METTALRLLHRLKPTSATNDRLRLQNLFLLFLAINPKFDTQHLVEWLKKGSIPEKDARGIVKTIFTTHRGPFSFALDPSIGWMIVSFVKDSEGCDSEDILKVPFLSSDTLSHQTDSAIHSMISAEIRVGDEIKLRILPKLWFVVHEIRPQYSSVMLITASVEGRKSRLKGREYKEVHCLSLIGCTVRRSTRQSILFQFPIPDPLGALESLATLVEDETQSFGVMGNGFDDFGGDHVLKMQRTSFVQVWLEKKNNLISAQKYLQHIHRTLSLSRIHWLAIGRALRVVSLGGRDLLETWQKWSQSCPSFLESNQTLSSVWLQFRPPTNADHPDVLRARDFLQERRQTLLEGYGHTSSSTATVSLSSDPLAKAVLDDATMALQNVALEFWSENSHQSLLQNNESQQREASSASLPSPVTVPCAVYVVSTSITRNAYQPSVTRQQAALGHFEEMSSCDAIIAPGDIISVSETGYDYPHLSQASRQWYFVHKVDLLFARILVSRSTLAPPLPWLLSTEEQPSELKHWIEISKLWHVLVCSPADAMGSSRNQRFQYRIFVTPTPDPMAAVRILKRLSERSPALELGTAHANHLSQKSRVSSQTKARGWRGAGGGGGGGDPTESERTSLVELDLLECTSTTLTLCWCCSGDTDYFVTDGGAWTGQSQTQSRSHGGGAVREEIGPVKISVRKSIDQHVYEWRDVYLGQGRGCMIECLEPDTVYHIRLTPLQQRPPFLSQETRAVRGPVYISARTEQKEE